MTTPALPNWQQLPDIALYLDQVLLYVNQIVAPHVAPEKESLTASMVNNYVKHHYIAKPIKKKYTKEQLAYLIAISLLKEVFAIQDLARVIQQLSALYKTDTLYNAFVDAISGDTDTQSDIHPLISSAGQTFLLHQQTKHLAHQLEESL
ncbi:DUF1836 domain-containing protein [Tuanshanicoccus lijuaniae]|uniref:DUF1836 domain-containing protein n=1 Tax=Aerococcaceae bacterium zg-1292 TaxID=2774330 RepID=UPI001938A5BF|nr:DUF1836 domain-containing protein [Aerococcaceae bacterium zg-1292]MBF6978217.1 DUF1836 domain-containing protein [Aerococcaceae bacterium zg-BR22]MBS4456435.1 DUF1836 domain-containing protein [Aerococcaceae bacterium zg-A91]MBS4458285.1 DUF1836 domain-containing protein [Aerococcaceae bacterium zg-BR33]QQA37483.1 DUF1836 domain-containing protein [Aerococcaceae bacterium zg-1292]